MNSTKKAHTEVLEEDIEVNGKQFKKGEIVVRGSTCPKCKTFYPFSHHLSACNNCGWRQKKLKPWEEKRKQKKLMKEKLNAQKK